MQTSIKRNVAVVGNETIVANTIFKEFSEIYSSLFEKYDELCSEAENKDKIDMYSAGMKIATIWHNQLKNPKDDFDADAIVSFENMFMCMNGWRNFKVVYNYPDEDVLLKGSDISGKVFEARHLIDIPFYSFFITGRKDWNIQGIFINIREIFV